MRTRVIQPEILETLPDDHPDAIQSRADLQKVNFIMGNHRWIVRQLRQHLKPNWRILEVGAGCGTLSLKLLSAGICQPHQLQALDLVGPPANWAAGATWYQGNMLEQPLPDAEVVIANLFLHHFTDEQLQLLGSLLPPSVRLILACEPARHRIHCWQGGLFCFLTRLNHVTRHDMQVSIRAGFRGEELHRALGLGSTWERTASSRPFGAYRFSAIQRLGK